MRSKTQHTPSVDNDAQQMALVASGEHSAFEKLYGKYSRIIEEYLQRHDGHNLSHEDIIQETFIRVWKSRQSFRSEASVKTYLLAIARNILSEERKQLKRRRAILEYSSKQQQNKLTQISTLSPNKDNGKVHKKIQTAVSKLTSDQKEAIKFYYYDQIVLFEAAECAGCSVEAFQSRLRRARQTLKSRLCHLIKKDYG